MVKCKNIKLENNNKNTSTIFRNSKFDIFLYQDIYDDIKERLLTPRYLNNRFKRIPDMNRFAEICQDILKQHDSSQFVTGREYFEISADELSA